MRTLLNLFIKHNHWFLFLLMEGIGIMLIVRFNSYHNATLFTSANSVAGNMFAVINNASSYFGLKKENAALLLHNQELLDKNAALHAALAHYRDSVAIESLPLAGENKFRYNTATVVNNSLNSINNFITIDKGTADGIDAEMGVFCPQGVVGIVYKASEHFSVIIPLLNSKSRISCRVHGADSFCTLQWDGKDTRYSHLVDLPRYTKFERGDTVVTSGFSSIFPGGIPVGIIEENEDTADGMFSRAKVRLFVDFSSLNNVFIVSNIGSREQKKLEKEIDGNEK